MRTGSEADEATSRYIPNTATPIMDLQPQHLESPVIPDGFPQPAAQVSG
jgi:hypothetical protein